MNCYFLSRNIDFSSPLRLVADSRHNLNVTVCVHKGKVCLTSLGSTRKSSTSRRILGVGCQVVQNRAYVIASRGSREIVMKVNPGLIVTAGQVISDLPSNFLFPDSTVSKIYRTSLEM